MPLPNPSSPLAAGLAHLWSEDTGNTDLVTDAAWTAVGTTPPVVVTPLGNARQGNSNGHLTFGARPDVFPGGTNQGSALAIVHIINSATGNGMYMGRVQSAFRFVQEYSGPSQLFATGVNSGFTTRVPPTSAANGALAYNGKVCAVLTVYNGSNVTFSVRVLEQGQSIASNSAALTGNFPSGSDPLSILARGDSGGRANNGIAVLATMAWNRALSAQEQLDILTDPQVLLRAPDTVDPVLPGPLVVTNITQTGYDLAWQQGTDNGVYVGVELSLNGGATWASLGNILGTSITGRTPGDLDQVRVRGRDASGRTSTPLSAAVQLQHLGVLGTTILLTTGSGTHGPGLLADSVQAGDESKRFNFAVTRRPTNGTLIEYPNGSFVYNGTADTFDYVLEVDGTPVAGPNPNGSATATMSFGGVVVDTTPPTLTLPTLTVTGSTTLDGGFTSNEAGRSWSVLIPSAQAAPSVAQIRAGLDALGGAAVSALLNQVMVAGVNTLSFTGASAGTSYRQHTFSEDGAPTPNVSGIVSSLARTTSAAVKKAVIPVTSDGVTPSPGLTGIRGAWWDSAIPDFATPPAITFTGEGTDASGVLELDLTGTSLNVGQTGTVLFVTSNGVAGSTANRAYCAPWVVSS